MACLRIEAYAWEPRLWQLPSSACGRRRDHARRGKELVGGWLFSTLRSPHNFGGQRRSRRAKGCSFCPPVRSRDEVQEPCLSMHLGKVVAGRQKLDGRVTLRGGRGKIYVAIPAYHHRGTGSSGFHVEQPASGRCRAAALCARARRSPWLPHLLAYTTPIGARSIAHCASLPARLAMRLQCDGMTDVRRQDRQGCDGEVWEPRL